MIELKLNADPALTQKYGRRIKMVGGDYTQVRGGAQERIVRIPDNEKDLMTTLLREFGNKIEDAAEKLAAVPDVRSAVQGLKTFVRAHNPGMTDTEITAAVEIAVKKILVAYEQKGQ
jgi:hypothetical protein